MFKVLCKIVSTLPEYLSEWILFLTGENCPLPSIIKPKPVDEALVEAPVT